MERDEALSLLKESRVEEWNQRRQREEEISSLSGADLSEAHLYQANLSRANLSRAKLSGANLSQANLSRANLSQANLSQAELREADLSQADLSRADLSGADLSGAGLIGADLYQADLSRANLNGANLSRAKLRGANLSRAKLRGANLIGADLSQANLSGASLSGANLSEADLSQANLSQANLMRANLREANLTESNLQNAMTGWTLFTFVDLSTVKGLDSIYHSGPSSIGQETLANSKVRIPEPFLKGCGFTPWEILSCRLYDPNLTPHEISELQYQVFDKRANGPLFIGGVFISYSWSNAKFVDKLYARLKEEQASVWLDRHDMVAGALQKQIHRAIRLNDIVVLVLSKASIESDFVANELEMARKKEKEEKRDVLCPIALDGAWKKKMDADEPNRALWLTLKQKNVLDFSKWKTKAFEPVYEKLVRGLKINYPRSDQTACVRETKY
jgi:uncharacterized protein YjbI with pentapeptide repeats